MKTLNIQWFPGHMNKTKRLLSENLKMVDVVIELLDARIPVSSKNPEIDGIVKNKPKIIVLNKCDLADREISNSWEKWYNSKGYTCIFINSVNGTGIKQLKLKIRDIMKEKIEKDRQKGRIFRPVRAMIVGIPNVGKSSLINKIAGRGSALTGDKPGITRGKQWINVNDEIQLLDTPGILWPKFEDKKVGIHLAITGAIKDEILDIVELASTLFEILSESYPEHIIKRYKLDTVENKSGPEILKEAGKKRGCIAPGGEIDMMRISAIVLDEFRSAKIGKISLERPEDNHIV